MGYAAAAALAAVVDLYRTGADPGFGQEGGCEGVCGWKSPIEVHGQRYSYSASYKLTTMT